MYIHYIIAWGVCSRWSTNGWLYAGLEGGEGVCVRGLGWGQRGGRGMGQWKWGGRGGELGQWLAIEGEFCFKIQWGMRMGIEIGKLYSSYIIQSLGSGGFRIPVKF